MPLPSPCNTLPDDTNNSMDVFVKDLRTDEVTLVSTDSHGNQAEGESYLPSLSANGRYVAFQGTASLVLEDTNNSFDIYVKDLRTDEVTLVSPNLQGSAGNEVIRFPSISSNGRYVAFESFPSASDDLRDYKVYVKDLRTDEVTLVSEALGGGGDSLAPYVTNDGDVVFASGSSDLVAHDTNGQFDIFLWA